MNLKVWTIIAFGLLCATQANAGEWKFGAQVSYVPGVEDVLDIYEDNLRYEPPGFYYDVDVAETLPIGIGFRGVYHADNGLRTDLSVGPLFLIAGDADHLQLPVAATIGFNFNHGGTVTPYVRAGLSHHFTSGDYVEDTSIGALGAIGIEFGHGRFFSWGLELAVDTASITLEDYGPHNDVGFGLRGLTEVEAYDRVISFYFTF
ncbi:hypothetical protein [Aurantivibrio plasticivorans]